jgi:hypothetical protein
VNTGGATTLAGTLTAVPAVPKLELYYTSSSTNLYHGATIQITNNVFSASIPADCVFTLASFDPAQASVSVAITNPVNGARFSAPANVPIYASAATTAGSISTVAFFNGTNKLGESAVAPYSIIWSNVAPGDYVLTARATNSLGNAGIAPSVGVEVVGPLARIDVTPTNAIVVPFGAQEFDAVGSDALGNVLISQPAFAWSANGGGTIDANGVFTAGESIGGPFTVSASNNGLSGTASITVITNLNLAPTGTGFAWYGLSGANGASPQVAKPGIIDNDLATDVPLTPGGGWDVHGAYEAAGVVWANPQTINKVIYRNGSYTGTQDGVFAADFKLQFSPDGLVWNDAGPEWGLAPAYVYSSAASAGVSFVFSGSITTVTGVRCVGRVRTTENSPPPNSWVANVTELQAFAGAIPPQPLPVLRASIGTNGIAIFWPASVTNFVLEATTDLSLPATWSPLTNAPQPVGQEQRVLLAPAASQQFFRLHKP